MPTLLSTTDNGAVGTYTITKPTVATGDVLAAVFVATDGSPAVPSGWTSIGTFNYSTTVNGLAAYRVVDGTEGSSFNFAGTGTAIWGVMLRYSGVDTTNVLDGTPTTVNTNVSDTATPASITTAVSGDELVLGVFGYATGSDGTAMTPSGSMTERSEKNYANTYFLAVATEALASSGATGTRSYTLSSPGATDITIGIMFALRASATGDATATLTTGQLDLAGTSLTATGQQNVSAILTTGQLDIAGTSLTVIGSTDVTAVLTTGVLDIAGTSLTATGIGNAIATLAVGQLDIAGTALTVTGIGNATVTLSPDDVLLEGTVLTATGQQHALATLLTGELTLEGGELVVVVARPWDGSSSSTLILTVVDGVSTSASGLSGSSQVDTVVPEGTTVQSEELLAESRME